MAWLTHGRGWDRTSDLPRVKRCRPSRPLTTRDAGTRFLTGLWPTGRVDAAWPRGRPQWRLCHYCATGNERQLRLDHGHDRRPRVNDDNSPRWSRRPCPVSSVRG